MAVETDGNLLVQAVALLGAAVVAVPVFKRLGLGSVLGYLAAGLAIGPWGFGLFSDPESVLHTAEFGIVLLLFIIGLEMKPSRLWSLRRDIFGLGLLQVAVCGALLGLAAYAAGLSGPAAFVAGMGFVLSSTAIVTQILEERGEIATRRGQKAVSILLLEDLAIVPLLAAVAVLAPVHPETGLSRWTQIAIAVAAVGSLLVVGRWLLNPMFKFFANSHAREVMTASALLVVLGAALVMQLGGLSMAMGAFLAGVLLSESSFRHELEADIEPFRGLLLGLFFLAVGMSLDLAVIARSWPWVLGGGAVFILVKGGAIYAVARLLRSNHREAIERAFLFAQGGEFAFVLYSTALGVGILDTETAAILNAAVIISMALTPLALILLDRFQQEEAISTENVEEPDGLRGTVLMIGFGRFAQVAAQGLLFRGIDVAIIDNDVEMIEAAGTFGFKVWYGDGTRLDVLRAAGAGEARIIAICIDKPEQANRIVEIAKEEFPLAQLLVRAFDRGHALALIKEGVDYQIRETFESAMIFGEEALRVLGVDEGEIEQTSDDVRRRDAARLEAQMAGGLLAGSDLGAGNLPRPTPTPLAPPRRSHRLNLRGTAPAEDEKTAAE